MVKVKSLNQSNVNNNNCNRYSINANPDKSIFKPQLPSNKHFNSMIILRLKIRNNYLTLKKIFKSIKQQQTREIPLLLFFKSILMALPLRQ